MSNIAPAIGAAALIGILSLVSWNLGKALHEKQGELTAMTTRHDQCIVQRNDAVKVTQAWAAKYKADMETKDNEYAKLYADQRAQARATCAAQFDAGYSYGRAMRDADPAGMRAQDSDFRSAWLGQAATH